jgi:hypothetical protein
VRSDSFVIVGVLSNNHGVTIVEYLFEIILGFPLVVGENSNNNKRSVKYDTQYPLSGGRG